MARRSRRHHHQLQIFSTVLITLLATSSLTSASSSSCQDTDQHPSNSHDTLLNYKLISIASILVSGAVGVYLPFSARRVSYLHPDGGAFAVLKAFAAGVILATGFIHILPEAFKSLTNPCLGENLFGKFPFAGFVAMMAAMGTLMMESLATGYHSRMELRKARPVLSGDDEENAAIDDQHHGNAGGGLRHGLDQIRTDSASQLVRHRIVSQVLEFGIVVHSVIIGLSLGASRSPKTIKPLIIALSFHQFFEGLGLGGCISQAKFKTRKIAIMVIFFALTTPTGIAIGICVSSSYNSSSSAALIVQGLLNSASAGILVYMALVDLLAAEFMNSPILLGNFKLQIGAQFSLLIGAAAMSILAILEP